MVSVKLRLNGLTWLKQSLPRLREKFLRSQDWDFVCLSCIEARVKNLNALVPGSEVSFILKPEGLDCLFVRTNLCQWCYTPPPHGNVLVAYIASSAITILPDATSILHTIPTKQNVNIHVLSHSIAWRAHSALFTSSACCQASFSAGPKSGDGGVAAAM